MPPLPSRSRRRSRRSRRSKQQAPVPLRGGARNPLLTPRDGSLTFHGTLLDQLCSWQGLSAETLLSSFNSLVQTFVTVGGVDDLKNKPRLLFPLIRSIIIREDQKSPPNEIRRKFRMIEDVLEDLVNWSDARRDEYITSLLCRRCPPHLFAPSSPSSSSLQENLPADMVRLPEVNYMFQVDNVERWMGKRLHDYLLLKDATSFQNAVVVNASHGELKATLKSCDVFEIPPGKSVTIISAVNPGHSYYTYTNGRDINKFIVSLVTEDYLQDHFFRKQESMADFITRHSVDVQSLRQIMDTLNSNYRDVRPFRPDDEENYKAWYTHHRPVSVRSFVEGDVAANRGIYVEANEPSPWGIFVFDENVPHNYIEYDPNVQKKLPYRWHPLQAGIGALKPTCTRF
jgi:hypothetical protein